MYRVDLSIDIIKKGGSHMKKVIVAILALAAGAAAVITAMKGNEEKCGY